MTLYDVCYRAKKELVVNFLLVKKQILNYFDLIHCYLWGPYHTTSSYGAWYLLTILDDFSRHV